MSKLKKVTIEDLQNKENFTTKEAAVFVNKQPQTLAFWRTKKTGPPYSKIGKGIIYQKSRLLDWLEANEVQAA